MLHSIIIGLLNFYTLIIFVYVILSWFPHEEGIIAEIYNVLGTLTEPYLGIFRKIIPPIGMVDISPMVAIIVLQLIGYGLLRIL